MRLISTDSVSKRKERYRDLVAAVSKNSDSLMYSSTLKMFLIL